MSVTVTGVPSAEAVGVMMESIEKFILQERVKFQVPSVTLEGSQVVEAE